jgi:hypothetical protein
MTFINSWLGSSLLHPDRNHHYIFGRHLDILKYSITFNIRYQLHLAEGENSLSSLTQM